MYREKRNDEELNIISLAMINGGACSYCCREVIATPFVMSTGAGSEWYARKRGHH